MRQNYVSAHRFFHGYWRFIIPMCLIRYWPAPWSSPVTSIIARFHRIGITTPPQHLCVYVPNVTNSPTPNFTAELKCSATLYFYRERRLVWILHFFPILDWKSIAWNIAFSSFVKWRIIIQENMVGSERKSIVSWASCFTPEHLHFATEFFLARWFLADVM